MVATQICLTLVSEEKEKQEVDFLVTENAQPLFMVEAKFSDVALSPNLIKFQLFFVTNQLGLYTRPNQALGLINHV
jgi:hypothetical protein